MRPLSNKIGRKKEVGVVKKVQVQSRAIKGSSTFIPSSVSTNMNVLKDATKHNFPAQACIQAANLPKRQSVNSKGKPMMTGRQNVKEVDMAEINEQSKQIRKSFTRKSSCSKRLNKSTSQSFVVPQLLADSYEGIKRKIKEIPDEDGKNKPAYLGLQNPEEVKDFYDLRKTYRNFYSFQFEEDLVPFLPDGEEDTRLRARMIDWMVECLSTFDQGDIVFFRAVMLLDLYFASFHKPDLKEEVHLAGIACMFMASKLDDYNCLSLETVYGKLAHKSFEKEKIISKEKQIL
jgi:hypothetical protein